MNDFENYFLYSTYVNNSQFQRYPKIIREISCEMCEMCGMRYIDIDM